MHSFSDSAPAPLAPEDSLDASDELPDEDDSARYCPTTQLARFALLMAGQGRCVNTDVMLGDREYAMWQLACAQASNDAELADAARRLFAYFDDPHHAAMPMVGLA